MPLKLTLLGFSIILAFTGCVYGPKAERKNVLDVLNGENYEASAQGPTQLVVPIVKKRERETHLQGAILHSAGGLEIPLRFVLIGVFSKKGERLAAATSDSDGKFHLTSVLHNGSYVLKVISDKYAGELPVEITDYEVKNLVLHAKTVSLQ